MIRGIDTSHKIVEERRANIGIKEQFESSI